MGLVSLAFVLPRESPAMSSTTPSRVPLREAAALSSVSVKTLRRRIADGTITGYRFGPRLLLVDLAELEAAMRPIPTRSTIA